jgi:hypothetical protein
MQSLWKAIGVAGVIAGGFCVGTMASAGLPGSSNGPSLDGVVQTITTNGPSLDGVVQGVMNGPSLDGVA